MDNINSLNRVKISYLVAFISFVFSSFYLANVTIFSPIYFSFVIVLSLIPMMLPLYFLCKMDYTRISLIYSAFSYIILLFIQMIYTNSMEIIKDYFFLAMMFCYIFIGVCCFYYISYIQKIKMIKIYFIISSLLLFVDFLFRVKLRNDRYIGLQFFYNFKNNGLMFQDSNFSGFLAMINLSFALYLTNRKILVFSRIKKILLFLLMFVNMSRAAILGSLVILLYSFYITKKQKTRMCLLFFLFIILMILIPFLLMYFFQDDSFMTKIAIFQDTKKYFETVSFKQLLFGNGLFTSPDYLGRSGHNYISQTIIEQGMLLFMIQISIMIKFLIASKKMCLYTIIPYLIAGLSCAPLQISYFFVINSLIISLERDN